MFAEIKSKPLQCFAGKNIICCPACSGCSQHIWHLINFWSLSYMIEGPKFFFPFGLEFRSSCSFAFLLWLSSFCSASSSSSGWIMSATVLFNPATAQKSNFPDSFGFFSMYTVKSLYYICLCSCVCKNNCIFLFQICLPKKADKLHSFIKLFIILLETITFS